MKVAVCLHGPLEYCDNCHWTVDWTARAEPARPELRDQAYAETVDRFGLFLTSSAKEAINWMVERYLDLLLPELRNFTPSELRWCGTHQVITPWPTATKGRFGWEHHVCETTARGEAPLVIDELTLRWPHSDE